MIHQHHVVLSAPAVFQGHVQYIPGAECRVSYRNRPGVDLFKDALPVEQPDVYSARIRRVEVHGLVVQFPKDRFLKQAPEHAGIFHFGHADGIRKSPRDPFRPQDGLCHSLRLCHELLSGPVPLSPRREFRVRDACGVVFPVKKVLQVPEHHHHRILLTGFFALRTHGRHDKPQQ